MQFDGTAILPASRKEAWDFLIDGEKVTRCLPGFQSLEVIDPQKQYRVEVASRFGSIDVRFEITITRTAAEPPSRARFQMRGKGRNSHIGASSYMHLDERADGTTELEWSFSFAAYGLIAQMGERMIEQVFQRVNAEFLDNIARNLAGGRGEEPRAAAG